MKLRSTLALLSLAVTAVLSAQEAPKPDPALKGLAAFTGTVQCKGSQTFTGKTIHYTQTVTGAWVLDGMWLDVRVTQHKTKENPMPFRGRSYMGYDAQSKKFVIYWVDNTGGFETAEGNGWEGDKFTFEGTAHMGPIVTKGRDVFTRSGKKLTHTYEIEQDGKWNEVMNETCTK